MEKQIDIVYEKIGWETPLKTSEDFILREIGREMTLVPVLAEGPLAKTMMTTNETSVWMWHQFEKISTSQVVLDKAVKIFDNGTPDHTEIEYGVYKYLVESLPLGVLIPVDNSCLPADKLMISEELEK